MCYGEWDSNPRQDRIGNKGLTTSPLDSSPVISEATSWGPNDAASQVIDCQVGCSPRLRTGVTRAGLLCRLSRANIERISISIDVYPFMATIVKLQKIGNSVRATIPKDVLEQLSLTQGQDMAVSVGSDDTILLKTRYKQRIDTPAQFYGILKGSTGRVEHWPTPEEIKSIWE